MAGHNILDKVGLALANGAARVEDPGDGGTLDLDSSKGFLVCELNSAGSETRVIPEPTYFAVGSRLLINGNDIATSGTDIDLSTADTTALDSSGNTAATLDTDGDSLELMVVTANGTKVWRIRYNDGATLS